MSAREFFGSLVSVHARDVNPFVSKVDTSVNIRAVEYLLGRSKSTLKSFIFGISINSRDTADVNYMGETPDYYPIWLRLKTPPEHNQMETLMGSLPGLSSLMLVIRLPEQIEYSHERNIGSFIQYAHIILNSAHPSLLTNVEVEIKSGPISILGSCFSRNGASLEASKVLKKTLFAFPVGRILLHHAVRVHRAGRPEFWSQVIRRVLPTLNERGRLTFAHRKQ